MGPNPKTNRLRSQQEYRGATVKVYFDSRTCIHAGDCLSRLPQVFDTSKRPWVKPNNAPAEQVIRTVDNCPSGALSYRLVELPDSL